MPDFVLASASPARLQTLRNAGLDPRVVVSGVDESQADHLPPEEMAARLADLKCAAVAARDDVPAGAVVLGCDSVLDLDGTALGKPADPDEAVRRWRDMRGRTGVLRTGHSLRIRGQDGPRGSGVAATRVHFADVTDAEITAYVASGEPLHVAGAFTVDGLGGAFVTRIEGDHHNVVGVSLPMLRTMLADLGLAWTDFWARGPIDQP